MSSECDASGSGAGPTGSSVASDESGRTLGRYQLLCPIGSGGMATVYVARARGAGGFERLVAIKHARPHVLEEEEAAALFLDEARLAALIHHPNVVATYDVGRDEDGRVWIAMEYVQGGRLADLLRVAWQRSERLAVGVVLRILVDMLRGLHAAHELRDSAGTPLHLVHRDVSPQNVIVGVDGVSRLLDFGIAKAAARMTVTRAGQVKGKPSYMAPEQLAAQPLTRAADLYASGVVLWEALTGCALFRGESEAQTVQAVMQGPVTPPSQHAPGVPPALDSVVLRALDRDPRRRFATAAEQADALESLDAPAAPALARDVARCVQELLGAELAQRAGRVAAAARAAAPPHATAGPVASPKGGGSRAALVGLAAGLMLVIVVVVALLVNRPNGLAPRASTPERTSIGSADVDADAAPSAASLRAGRVAAEADAAPGEAPPRRARPTGRRTRARRKARSRRKARPARAGRAKPGKSPPEVFRPLAP